MPQVRKLSPDEVRTIEGRIKGQRKLVEEEYDTILGDYAMGEYGEATLEPDENRITVRNRLKAAAVRRGVALEFRRTKGDQLRFKVLPSGENVDSDESDDDIEDTESDESDESDEGNSVSVSSEEPPASNGRRGRGRAKKAA